MIISVRYRFCHPVLVLSNRFINSVLLNSALFLNNKIAQTQQQQRKRLIFECKRLRNIWIVFTHTFAFGIRLPIFFLSLHL